MSQWKIFTSSFCHQNGEIFSVTRETLLLEKFLHWLALTKEEEEEEMWEKFKEIISFSKVEDDDDNEINFLNESSIFSLYWVVEGFDWKCQDDELSLSVSRVNYVKVGIIC